MNCLLHLYLLLLLRYICSIEVIDLSAFINSPQDSSINERQIRQTSLSIDKALRDDGLFILTNHGIDRSLYDESILAAYRLFDLMDSLPESNRSHVSMTNSNSSSFGRGYIGFGDESGLSRYFEPKEGFSYGHPDNNSTSSSIYNNMLRAENKWPHSFSGDDVNTLNQLFREKVRIAKLVIGILSTTFDCETKGSESDTSPFNLPVDPIDILQHPPPSSLYDISNHGEDISIMRVFHYFNVNSQKIQNHVDANETSGSGLQMLGSSPHTDWGFLTIILADDIRGLQFIARHSKTTADSPAHDSTSGSSIWQDVPYIPGSLVVNGGDYLSMLSRGVYHSPVHRVLSPGTHNHADMQCTHIHTSSEQKRCSSSNDRHSFVFFFYPGYDSPVTDHLLSHCCHCVVPHSACHSRENSIIIDSMSSNDILIDEHLSRVEVDIEFNTLLSVASSTNASPGPTNSNNQASMVAGRVSITNSATTSLASGWKSTANKKAINSVD